MPGLISGPWLPRSPTTGPIYALQLLSVTDSPSPVAGSAPNRLDNGTSVARALPHPAGRLAVATQQTKAGLSRQAKAGTAFRVAPNAYIVGATLAPEQAVAHHRTAIISMFWPGSVLSDRTALTGGMPFEGWIFISIRTQPAAPTWNCPGSQSQSVSARVRCRAICRCQTDSIFRVRPGDSSRTSASPDDLPAGVRVAKQAPNWSETRSTRWPAKVVPARSTMS